MSIGGAVYPGAYFAAQVQGDLGVLGDAGIYGDGMITEHLYLGGNDTYTGSLRVQSQDVTGQDYSAQIQVSDPTMKALDIQMESIGTVFKVSGNGNTVISNGSPPATNGKLAVTSTSEVLDLVNTGTNGWGNMISFYDGTGAGRHLIYDDFGPTSGTSATMGDLVIQTATSGNPNGKLWVNGKMEIGGGRPVSTYTDYSLSVNGNIVTKKVIVETSDWADRVFDKSYHLTPLSDVEAYVNQNKHLPDVPSECEAIDNGVDVGEMNKVLLQKVEELTLYVIHQQKEIDALKNK